MRVAPCQQRDVAVDLQRIGERNRIVVDQRAHVVEPVPGERRWETASRTVVPVAHGIRLPLSSVTVMVLRLVFIAGLRDPQGNFLTVGHAWLFQLLEETVLFRSMSLCSYTQLFIGEKHLFIGLFVSPALLLSHESSR